MAVVWPTGRLRAAVAPVLVAVAAAAAVGVVAVVDPNEPGHYPTCPFLAATGRHCPGCGSLRAVHALAHGDLGAAVGLNALAVGGILLLAAIWLRWVGARVAGRSRAQLAPAPAVWVLLALVLVFWVTRNLPFGTSLAP